MEVDAKTTIHTGDVFSNDAVVVVLSRRAVSTLVRACSSHGTFPPGHVDNAPGDASPGSGAPSPGGNPGGPCKGLSSACCRRSASGRQYRVSGETEGHKGASYTCRTPSRTKREASGEKRAGSGLPSSPALSPSVFSGPSPCKDVIPYAHITYESDANTGGESMSGVKPSVEGARRKRTDDIPASASAQHGFSLEHSCSRVAATAPVERHTGEGSRRAVAGCYGFVDEEAVSPRKVVPSSAAVSTAHAKNQTGAPDNAGDFSAECDEGTCRSGGSTGESLATNSFSTEGCSSQQRGDWTAGAAPFRSEANETRNKSCCSAFSLDDINDFLAAALRAARSSLYVCIQIIGEDVGDPDCMSSPPPAVDCHNKRASRSTGMTGGKEAAAVERSPEGPSDPVDNRGHGIHEHPRDAATTPACACASASSQAAITVSLSGVSLSRTSLRKTPSPADAAAARTAAEPVAASAAAEAVGLDPAALPRGLPAAPAAAYGAGIRFKGVSGRVGASLCACVGSAVGYVSGNKTTPASRPRTSGLFCRYTQLDCRQPVATPTCCVFRIIRHIYAFLSSCAAAFAPFAADVYVVPVWADAESMNVCATCSGASAWNSTTARRGRATERPAVPESLWLSAVSPAAPPASGSGTNVEGYGGLGVSEAYEPEASLATAPALLGASASAGTNTECESPNNCEWHLRLLQAVQSHWQSCRAFHVSGGKIVNLVDPTFHVAARDFAVFLSAGQASATYTRVLERGKASARTWPSFSEVLSALRVPAPPTAAAAANRGDAAPVAETGEGMKCVSEPVSAAEVSTCGTELADQPEGALQRQEGALLKHSREEKMSNMRVAKPAAAGAEDNRAGTEACVASVVRGAACMAAGSSKAASEGTTIEDVGAAERHRLQPTHLATLRTVHQFRHVIVAGTFDRLHAGHKLMLTVAALLSSERLDIGLTAGALVHKKAGGDAAEAAAAVQSFAARARAAASFVALVASAAHRVSQPLFTEFSGSKARLGTTPISAASLEKDSAANTSRRDASAAASVASCTPAVRAAGQRLWEADFRKTGSLVEEAEKAERSLEAAVHEGECGRASLTHATSTPREPVTEPEGSTRAAGSPACEDPGETAATYFSSSSLPIYFVNYCQTVLRDEVGDIAGTQYDTSVSAVHAGSPDADQTHPCQAALQEEAAVAPPDDAAARRVTQCFPFADRDKNEDAVRPHGNTDGDLKEAKGHYAGPYITRQCTRPARRRGEADEGAAALETTSAAKASRPAAVERGPKEQAAGKQESATKCNASPTGLKPGQQATPAAGQDVGRDEAEHHEEEVARVEGLEVHLTQLVCEALAETPPAEATTAALSQNSTIPLKTAREGYVRFVGSSRPLCARLDNTSLDVTGQRIVLPWTSSLLPPGFLFRRTATAAGSQRRAITQTPGRVRDEAVGDDVSNHTSRERSRSASPAAAAARSRSAAGAASALAASSTSGGPASGSRSASGGGAASPASAWKQDATVIAPSSSRFSSPSYVTARDTRDAAVSVAGHLRGHRFIDDPLARTHAWTQHPYPDSIASRGRAPLRVYVTSIEDPVGPAGYLAFDALVVSSESLEGGFLVNEERSKKCRYPVCLIEVPALPVTDVRAASPDCAAFAEERPATAPLQRHIASCFATASSCAGYRGRTPSLAQIDYTVSAEEPRDAFVCKRGKSHGGGAAAPEGSCVATTHVLNSTTSLSVPHEVPGYPSGGASVAVQLNSIEREEGAADAAAELRAGITQLAPNIQIGDEYAADRRTLGVGGGTRKAEDDGRAFLASERCARSPRARERARPRCTQAAADPVEKLSSSALRQQQTAALQRGVDIVALRRAFIAAVSIVVHAPGPVWRAYWSLLCSLYVAPWRRLFTLERLGRLLVRLDAVKQRVSGLSRWGGIAEAVVIISLCFAYAVHAPPGLCPYLALPARTGAAPECLSLHQGDARPGQSAAGSATEGAAQKCLACPTPSLSPSVGDRPRAPDIGSENIPRCARALARAHDAEHSVFDGVCGANEALARDFMRDAMVCCRLRAYCPKARSPKQRPVSGGSAKSPICGCIDTALQDASHTDTSRALLEDVRRNDNAHQRAADLSVLRVIVSCIQTARKSCAFLLPRGPFSLGEHYQTRSSFETGFQEEDRRIWSGRGSGLKPNGGAENRSLCSLEHERDRVRKKEKASVRMVADLELFESKCCDIVRMLEILELALPQETYDLCARRMREEYYHLGDLHYARCRYQQLELLQLRFSRAPREVTETEGAQIRQNLLRERAALHLDNGMRCVGADANCAYAR